jgi:uncharacterized protein (TIGR03435 family)
MRRYRTFEQAFLWAVLAMAAVATILVSASLLHAQDSRPDWQKTAGGKMSFDVTSVKQNKSGAPAYRASSNFPLSMGNSYPPKGGFLSGTNYRLSSYIGFAYKLNSHQTQALQAQLPKWANEEQFDIEARGAETATKDQMRLMMQSLLADRFKLAVHTETRTGPLLALVLVKPGAPGPNLRPHPESGPCGDFTLSAAARSASGMPSSCDVFLTLIDAGDAKTSAQNVTMAMIAGAMPFPGMGPLDRPVVDKTGLNGNFDFSIEFAPEDPTPKGAPVDTTQATPLEALRDQLGLKLESATGPIDALIVDHIEEPSPN